MATENFDKLSEEKRQTVINAALACFGRDGYKKTAISEISAAAGISKASIFQYFGTKKELYIFLYKFACDRILTNMTEGTEDFFECLKTGTLIKMRVMKMYPGMYDFLLSLVKESDSELSSELKAINNGETRRGIALLFEKVDWGRFKPEYDRATIMNLVSWISEGCIKQNAEKMTGEQIAAESDRYMEIMKKALYKEEYL